MATGSLGTISVVDTILPVGFPSNVHLTKSIFRVSVPATWSGVVLSKRPHLSIVVSIENTEGVWGIGYGSYYLPTTSGTNVTISVDVPIPANELTDGTTYEIVVKCSLVDAQTDANFLDLNDLDPWKTFTYRAYDYPSISSFSILRCLQNGTADESGTYAKATIAYVVSPINNINTKALKVYRRAVGATEWTLDSTLDITALGYSGTSGPTVLSLVYAADAAFDLKAEITDLITTGSNIKPLSVAITTIDFDTVNHKVSVGKRVEATGPQLDVAGDSRFGGASKFVVAPVFDERLESRKAIGVQAGSIDFSVGADTAQILSVTFDEEFETAPVITATAVASSTWGVASYFLIVYVVAGSVTTSGFQLRVVNNYNATRSGKINWIAIG